MGYHDAPIVDNPDDVVYKICVTNCEGNPLEKVIIKIIIQTVPSSDGT